MDKDRPKREGLIFLFNPTVTSGELTAQQIILIINLEG
jgi:hypothetical protein